MSNELDPIVDQWYQHRDKGELMRVVTVDTAAGVIEIQDFDGDIEAMDLDTWREHRKIGPDLMTISRPMIWVTHRIPS